MLATVWLVNCRYHLELTSIAICETNTALLEFTDDCLPIIYIWEASQHGDFFSAHLFDFDASDNVEGLGDLLLTQSQHLALGRGRLGGMRRGENKGQGHDY